MKTYSKPTLKTCYLLVCIFCVFSFGLMFGLLFNWDSNQCHKTTTNNNKQELISIDETFLVVVIFSTSFNADRRQAIRQTWLQLNGDRKSRHYFIVGTLDLNSSEMSSLYEEQKQHNDLLLFFHLRDTYSSLSHKLLLTLKWFANKLQFKYLVKVDDDSFLRIDQLFDELVENRFHTNDSKPLYMGYFDGRARVKRSGQWSEPNWFLCDRYLPYALGGGYVLSEQLVNYVSQSSHLLKLYRSEDVSLGVWLSSLDINRVHDIRFDTEYQSRGCLNSHLITHKQSAENMKILYKNLQTLGKLCKTEIETKYVYEYNWKSQPSLCCHRNLSAKVRHNKEI